VVTAATQRRQAEKVELRNGTSARPCPEAAAAECLRKYTSLAKTVMQFEKAWFRGWAENVDSMAMYHLKQPIIFTDTKCEPNEIKVGSTLQREPCLKARSVSALQTKIREAKI